MKKFRWLAILLLPALVVLAGIFWLGSICPPGVPVSQFLPLARQVHQAQRLLADARQAPDPAGVDRLEALLADAGLAVVDTDSVLPSYLANPQGLRQFCQQAGAGQRAAQTVFQIQPTGLSCLRFFSGHGDSGCLIARLFWSRDGSLEWQECQLLPLYDMALVQDNTFYYRLYPAGDPHYIDYSFFRLTPPDPELEALCSRYVSCVGYRFVNLFLCDWQEGDWGALAFSDLFEYLYPLRFGREVTLDQFPLESGSTCRVPQEVFVQTITPFFAITPEALWALCPHTQDSYLWRPVHGNDLTGWELPLYLPEVTACTENPDGTRTLSVQVRCPEYKTNALFTHEVTIRPTASGFQYVANRVTGGWEALPPGQARAVLFRQ